MIFDARHRADNLGALCIALMYAVLLGAIGWLLLGNHDTAFLHPRFRPFLAGSAAILCGFAVGALSDFRSGKARERWYAAILKSLVLITPVLFMGAVAGQSMGVQALANRAVALDTDTFGIYSQDEAAGAGIDDTQQKRSLLQIARTMRQLDGRPVETEGMVYSDGNMPARFLLLFRFGIYCCAADAIPVWVLVDKGQAPAMENEQWVRVAGILRVTPINGRELPVIIADDITPMPSPPPGAQYLFF